MLGTSRTEYVFIRVSVAALRSITPLSFVYVTAWLGLRVLGPSKLCPPAWTLIWPAAECIFYLCVLPWSRRLQRAAEHPPIPPRAERERLFELCQSHIPDIRAYNAGWYRGSDSSTLRRENVEDWLLWSVFSAPHAEPEWHDELDAYVRRIEGRLGHEIPPGRNPDVKSMRLTLDEVPMLHRPLVWYMIVMLVDTITYAALYRLGYRHYVPRRSSLAVFPPRPLVTLLSTRSTAPLPYWYRPHRSSARKPLLFLHGIGIGLWPYVPFFGELAVIEPDVGVVAIEFLPISMRITAPMPDHTATVAAVHAALDEHFAPDDDFVVAGHSYGTVVAAHLLRADARHTDVESLHPKTPARRVAALALIDPIPLLLHLPDTAHNFVYRTPGAWRANEYQLWFFASRDSGVAHTLSRRFFWGDNIIWKSDLQDVRSAVVLSERDQIIPVAELWAYLTGSAVEWGEEKFGLDWTSDDGKMEVAFYRDVDHSQVFERRACRAGVLDALRRLMK